MLPDGQVVLTSVLSHHPLSRLGGSSKIFAKVFEVIRLLHSGDAEAVWGLAQLVYPSQFGMSLEDLGETLEHPDNLCLGSFNSSLLVGYLMCWPDFCQVEGMEDQPILLVDDVVVRPGHQAQLHRLLLSLREHIVARRLEGLPLEGNSRSQAHQLWQRHPRILAKLGYTCVASYEITDPDGGESLTWVRYEPVSSALSRKPLSE
jgi:hypothetical protein